MPGPKPSDPMMRFMAKVSIDQNSGCWLWRGCTQGFGYGCFYLEKKRQQAHRAVLMLNGVNIEGKVVLHICDRPSCVNPAHLRVGTHAENIADMVAKGRNAKGDSHGMRTKPDRRSFRDKNGSAKLSELQVQAIKECTLPNRRIAALVGVHPSTIGRIKRCNIDQMEKAHAADV